LDFDGPADRRYHAGKFNQQPIADDPHYPAAVFSYFWIDDFASIQFERRVSTFLISAHQPAVAGDIGREDGGQTPFDVRLGHSTVPGSRRVYGQEDGVSIEQPVPLWVKSGTFCDATAMSALLPIAGRLVA
jgi:hypothetical protein